MAIHGTASLEVRKSRMKELERVMGRVHGSHAAVGVLGKDAQRDDDSPLSNIEIAAVHEFGSADGRIPERSFIRATIQRNLGPYRKVVKLLLRGMALGTFSVKKALGILGARAQADIRRTIQTSQDLAPLSQVTIDRRRAKRKSTKGRKGRGGNRPLLDTGQLVQSIQWEARER